MNELGTFMNRCNTTAGFQEAVEQAKKADVAVVFIGLWLQENEGWDRIELRYARLSC